MHSVGSWAPQEFVDCLVSAAEAPAARGAHKVSYIHQFNRGVASQASVDSPPFKLLLMHGHCSVKVLGKNTLTVPWSSPSTSLSEYFSGLSFNIYSSVHRLYGAPGAYFLVQNPLISHMHVGNHEALEQLISEIFTHAHQEEDHACALWLQRHHKILQPYFENGFKDTVLALCELGVEISEVVSLKPAEAMFDQVKAEIPVLGFNHICALPRTQSPRTDLIISLMNDAATNVWWSTGLDIRNGLEWLWVQPIFAWGLTCSFPSKDH